MGHDEDNKNYKTDVLDLHIEVRSSSTPPWSALHEVREPGKFVGYRDPRTGKGSGYYKDGKVIGHELVRYPPKWKFVANIQ